MFQKLGIFKSKSEPVGDPARDGLEPRDKVIVASSEADAQIVKSGTAVALKDVENPDEGDIEADFAFMSDILSKAGVLEGQQAEQFAEPHPTAMAQAPVQSATSSPAKSAAPDFVPIHKRGANADQGKPVFAVQDGPRSLQPEFLSKPTEAPAEAAIKHAPAEPTVIYVPVPASAMPHPQAMPAGHPVPVAAQTTAAVAQPVPVAMPVSPPPPQAVPSTAQAEYETAPVAQAVPHAPASPAQMPPVAAPMAQPVDNNVAAPDAHAARIPAEPDQLALPFDASPAAVPEAPAMPIPVAMPAPSAVEAEMPVPHAIAAPVGSVAPQTPAEIAPSPVVAPSPEEIENALEVLAMQSASKARAAAASAAQAPAADTVEQVSAPAHAPKAEEVVGRKSMFAARPKAAKAPKIQREQPHDDAHFEPPKLVRKIMSAIPSAEGAKGRSEYAKARLARDPFDRLLDEAQGC